MVTIRIYNYAAVPQAEIDTARAVANGIFHKTGISLQWIDCAVSPAPPAPPAPVAPLAPLAPPAPRSSCTAPLGDVEFVLRLLQLPDGDHAPHMSLGFSLVELDAHTGVLITIDPARAAAVAAQAHTDSSLVLGRAIAHEVGHLLLGTSRHGRSGLMRALWSQRELRENRPADWLFSVREANLMRQGLVLRNRETN